MMSHLSIRSVAWLAAPLIACGDTAPPATSDTAIPSDTSESDTTVLPDSATNDTATPDAATNDSTPADSTPADTATSPAVLVRIVDVSPPTLPAVAPGPITVVFEASDFAPARDALSVSNLTLANNATAVTATPCRDGLFCATLQPLPTAPGHITFSLGVGLSKLEASVGFFASANTIPAPNTHIIPLPSMKQAPAWAAPVDFDNDGAMDLVVFEPTDPPPANGTVPRAPSPSARLKAFKATSAGFSLQSELSIPNPAPGESAIHIFGDRVVGRIGARTQGPTRVETFAIDAAGTLSRPTISLSFDGQTQRPLSVDTWSTSRGALPVVLVHAPANPIEPAPGALGRYYLAWEAPAIGGRTSFQRTLNYSPDELSAIGRAGTESVAMAWSPPGTTRPADALAVHVASLGDVINPTTGAGFAGIHILSDDPAGTVSRQWLSPSHPIDWNDTHRTLDAALHDLDGNGLPDLVYTVTFGNHTWFSDYCLARGNPDANGVIRDFAFDTCARLAENLTPFLAEIPSGVIGYATLPGMCIEHARVTTDAAGRWFETTLGCSDTQAAGPVTQLRIPLEGSGSGTGARPVEATARFAPGDGNPRIGRKGGGMSVELVVVDGGVSRLMAVAHDFPGLVEVPAPAPAPEVDAPENFGAQGILRIEHAVFLPESNTMRAAVAVPGRANVQRSLLKPTSGAVWEPTRPLVSLQGEAIQVVDVNASGEIIAVSQRVSLPGGSGAGPRVQVATNDTDSVIRTIAIILESEPQTLDPVHVASGVVVPGRDNDAVAIDVTMQTGATARKVKVATRPLDNQRLEVIAVTENGVWAGVHDDRTMQAGPTRLTKLAMPVPDGYTAEPLFVRSVFESRDDAGETELRLWAGPRTGDADVGPVAPGLAYRVVRAAGEAPTLVLDMPADSADGAPLLGPMSWPDGGCGFIAAEHDDDGIHFTATHYGQRGGLARYPVHYHMARDTSDDTWRNTDKVVTALVGMGGARSGGDWNGDGFGDLLVPVDRWLHAALRDDLPGIATTGSLLLASNGAGGFMPPEPAPAMTGAVPYAGGGGGPWVWSLDGSVSTSQLDDCVFEFGVMHF